MKHEGLVESISQRLLNHARNSGEAFDFALAGWRVAKLGPNELTTTHVKRLVSLVSDDLYILQQ